MRHLCHGHVSPQPSAAGALISGVLSLLTLAGCGGPAAGGNCMYMPAVTGTVTVTTIDPVSQSAPKDAGQPCHRVNYSWTTGGPAVFTNADAIFASDACITTANLKVGSTFQVTRQEAISGTCTPSVRTIGDAAVNACNAACQ